jgi:hypothetical protein
MSAYLKDYRRLTGLREAKPSGVSFKMSRVAGGRVGFDLFTNDLDVNLTDDEKNWSASPETFKPNQFARVELGKVLLSLDRVTDGEPPPDVSAEATPFAQMLKAVKTKSTPSKRSPELATVFSTRGAIVGSQFQGKGYGIALFLKMLEYASDEGYWLVSDFKQSDSPAGQGAWRALQRYAQRQYEGVYWTTVLPPQTSHPFFAAYGVNPAGKKALSAMKF